MTVENEELDEAQICNKRRIKKKRRLSKQSLSSKKIQIYKNNTDLIKGLNEVQFGQ